MNLVHEALISLAEFLSNELRKHKKTRISILIISLIAFLTSLILLTIYFNDLVDYQYFLIGTTLAISIFFLLSSLLSFTNEHFSIRNPFDLELKNLTKEREELKKKSISEGSESNENVFNTIQLNLNQTTEYYTINKSQARKSFGASITAIVAGLITILAGIWLIYFQESITASVISMVAGVLLEIIGGMYFHIYNKSLEQLNYFYGKLEKMQDTMIAIELTNSIDDDTKKNELQEKIIVKLLDRSSGN